MYYFIIVVLICLLDQLSKFCVEQFILRGSSIPVINNIFHVTLVYNTGAAFGMFNRHPHLFVIVAVLAIILIGYFLLQRSWRMNVPEKVALCFILGGTLGNLIDRVRCGYVIDFIDFRIWPVFNLADSFITIGAVMLGLSILAGIRHSGRGRKEEA